MRILAIDPGAKGAGYCLLGAPRPLTILDINDRLDSIWTHPPDVIVCESGFIGKMGRQAMWGLGADAGWRMCEAWLAFGRTPRLFTIRPDGPNGWRAALPSRPDLPAARRFTKHDGLPGDVIVARLRLRYGFVSEADGGPTEHVVEACGIAEAAAVILARPLAKDRKALKAVRR